MTPSNMIEIRKGKDDAKMQNYRTETRILSRPGGRIPEAGDDEAVLRIYRGTGVHRRIAYRMPAEFLWWGLERHLHLLRHTHASRRGKSPDEGRATHFHRLLL